MFQCLLITKSSVVSRCNVLFDTDVSKCCVSSLTHIKSSVIRQYVGCDNQSHVTSDGTRHIVSSCIGHLSHKFYSTFKRHFKCLAVFSSVL